MSLILFTDALSGNDNAGGSSEGSPKVSGINGVVTSGSQTIDLSGDSPDLSAVVSGDTIRISGYTDGIRSGEIFEITSINDGADTVDVVQTPISSNSNLTWAIGGAFKTIQKPINVMGVGDALWIKASAIYQENIVQAINGVVANTISFQGYSSVSGDGGSMILDGSSNPGIGWKARPFCFYKNLRITNFSGNGVQGNNNLNFSDFVNCEFDNNTNGIVLRSQNTLIGCYMHDNSARGCSITNQYNTLVSCIFENNVTEGITIGGKYSTLIKCLIIGNHTFGIWIFNNNNHTIINCTIDGKNQTTSTGVNFSSTSTGGHVFFNNIIVGCVLGVSSSVDYGEMPFSVNNLLFNNDVNYSNFRTNRGEVLADPLFVDPANLDYSLSDNSPALNAGFDIKSNPWLAVAAEAISIGAY